MFEVDVKNVTEKEGRRRRGGGGDQLGFGFLMRSFMDKLYDYWADVLTDQYTDGLID